ncbi:hypothetical protein U0038_17680 [Sphingobacterium spiritivorum]|uniref:Uncharacterized protein n=1 Tax=Sphingobacterium spiritivorum ATCC 33861 TaxID=525373 RepID=D7VN22_SPHSI|nr:hypothetical protein [Sphingobacterium spiritivorum]EFK57319.1 hypothetical protein HMPREF0766_12392 [Sphingobacterium spiritivorum ATCC 33861]QQT36599.1 hypothetical protein I6J01_03970 [Sphingobacterium spiritivorum]WQD33350.1 hypothetical protein U0038_17680 [Sphingobacterium spiritivorum]SUJ22658.1 Uncharacterised protein [Sphingobacterium spiritivorum]
MATSNKWDETKPYYWCDTENTRAVLEHLWNYLIHHPENGIFILGTRKRTPNSITINTLVNSNIININITIDDKDLREGITESIKIIMEDALLIDKHFILNSKESRNNTQNLQYIWQQKDKK